MTSTRHREREERQLGHERHGEAEVIGRIPAIVRQPIQALEKRHRGRVDAADREARRDAEEHEDEDEDAERRPLGALRIGQMLEVRVVDSSVPQKICFVTRST